MGSKDLDAAKATTEAVNSLAEGWLQTADQVMSSIWQYETAVEKLYASQARSTRLHSESFYRIL